MESNKNWKKQEDSWHNVKIIRKNQAKLLRRLDDAMTYRRQIISAGKKFELFFCRPDQISFRVNERGRYRMERTDCEYLCGLPVDKIGFTMRRLFNHLGGRKDFQEINHKGTKANQAMNNVKLKRSFAGSCISGG